MMTRRFRVVPMLQPELAKVADGRSRSASSTPGRDHQAVRLAHAASYVWDFGQEPRRGRGDYTGAHATRKRKHHDGQVRPSCDACQAGSTIAHRAVNSVPIRSQIVDGSGCICLNRKSWALNSAVECHPHTVEVVGSNPTAPTTELTVATEVRCPAFPVGSKLVTIRHQLGKFLYRRPLMEGGWCKSPEWL